MDSKDKRICELETEVARLRAEVFTLKAAAIGPGSFHQQMVTILRGVPLPTQNQPEGSFWNPQL